MVHNAFSSSIIDPQLVETLIILILKVDHPTHMKEFRPISLCNVLYKIITEVLVNRIWPFLQDLIRIRGRKGAMAFKIDLEKAYDWNFLKATL